MKAGIIAVGMLALANLAALYSLSKKIDDLDSAIYELHHAVDEARDEATAAKDAAEATR